MACDLLYLYIWKKKTLSFTQKLSRNDYSFCFIGQTTLFPVIQVSSLGEATLRSGS